MPGTKNMKRSQKVIQNVAFGESCQMLYYFYEFQVIVIAFVCLRKILPETASFSGTHENIQCIWQNNVKRRIAECQGRQHFGLSLLPEISVSFTWNIFLISSSPSFFDTIPTNSFRSKAKKRICAKKGLY
jgi:hypothetical protein